MEAVDLKEQGGAFAIDGYGAFQRLMDDLIENQEKVENAGTICKQYVERNAGATTKILSHIF
jgi:3-deoxy-D-manno-octulosonic-acid transferase